MATEQDEDVRKVLRSKRGGGKEGGEGGGREGRKKKRKRIYIDRSVLGASQSKYH